MTDSPFHGVIPPVVIPLTEKKQLDLEAFERSINRMIDAGVDGLFFLGSSGEVAFLTDAQRYRRPSDTSVYAAAHNPSREKRSIRAASSPPTFPPCGGYFAPTAGAAPAPGTRRTG